MKRFGSRKLVQHRFKSGTLSNWKEQDHVVLEELFHKNKAPLFRHRATLTNRDGSSQTNHSTTQEISEIDRNLTESKLNTPVDFKYYLRNLNNLSNFHQLPYKFGSNQVFDSSTDLKSILWDFKAPIRYAFGYGSGVFSQGTNSHSATPPQTDLIFVVTYPSHWHSLNVAQFPHHYSFLKYLGSSVISHIQELGAGVYFNPYVKGLGNNKNNMTKYGVSSMDNLVSDLVNWDSLYLAGRMHKPTMILRNSANISLLQNFNLVNALKTSLLLLDKDSNKFSVSQEQLYKTITALSYNGDPRMKVGGEHKDKISNIVTNQLESFSNLYQPLLESYFRDIVTMDNDNIKVDLSSESRLNLIAELPLNLRRKLFSKYTTKYGTEFAKDPVSQHVVNPVKQDSQSPKIEFKELQSLTDLQGVSSADYEYIPTHLKLSPFVSQIAQDKDFTNHLNESLKEIIFAPALKQSLKGIATAGLIKSFDYALEKRLKYLKSTKK